MRKHARTISIGLMAAILGLAGCTNVDGTSNQPGSGAIIGGLTGAAAGQIIGSNTRSTLIGGALGAAVGGLIGTQLAAQERELRQSLSGTGVGITNTGSDLRVVLPESVTFSTGSSVVNPGFRPALQAVSESLRRHPNTAVQVIGHTDNVGTAAFNNQLSENRATSVARILIDEGTSAARIRVSGRGFNEPIASNASAAGRAENRRVEIMITPTN